MANEKCCQCGKPGPILFPHGFFCELCFDAYYYGSPGAIRALNEQWAMPPADIPVLSKR